MRIGTFVAIAALGFSLLFPRAAFCQSTQDGGLLKAHAHTSTNDGGSSLRPVTVAASNYVSAPIGVFANLSITAPIIPAGTVFPYASSSVPTGFFECDGTAKSQTTYNVLYAVLGCSWGCSGGNFSLPDLRGVFLRGWNHGVSVSSITTQYNGDYDSAARSTITAGGASGDNVGSYQIDGFRSHVHGLDNEPFSNPGTPGGTGTLSVQSGNTSASGGNETRPKNAYVMFIIKYDNSTTGSTTTVQNSSFSFITSATVTVNASMTGSGATSNPLGVNSSSVAVLNASGFVPNFQIDSSSIVKQGAALINAVAITATGQVFAGNFASTNLSLIGTNSASLSTLSGDVKLEPGGAGQSPAPLTVLMTGRNVSLGYGIIAASATFTNAIVTSTLTVGGNAFSVGGSSFTVTGGSVTIPYSLAIGPLTAVDPLDVRGQGANIFGTNNAIARFSTNSATNAGILIGVDNSGQIGTLTANTAAAASSMAFWTYSGAAWGERMRINGVGSVGIGTTVPASTATLQVAGTVIYRGITDGLDASSGTVGEYISTTPVANIAPAATGVAQTLSTMTLTAGDWEVVGQGYLTVSTLSGSGIVVCVSLNALSCDNSQSRSGMSAALTATNDISIQTARRRFNVTVPTAVYLVELLNYTVDTGSLWSATASGMTARRMR